ncbi:unnamed protein product [Lota lota]
MHDSQDGSKHAVHGGHDSQNPFIQQGLPGHAAAADRSVLQYALSRINNFTMSSTDRKPTHRSPFWKLWNF